MPKSGVELERLVQWIASTIYAGAKVTPNAEVPDVDSGQLREVDILIEQPGGLVPVRIIGEVRDRAGAQGSQWIEQVHGKMRSVRASAAFAVSSSGFSEPAVAKAKALNIQLYSLESAMGARWEHLVRPTKLDIISPAVSLDLALLDHRTQCSFVPDETSVRRWAPHGEPPFGPLDLREHPLAQDVAAMQARAISDTARARRGRGACQVTSFRHELLSGIARFRDTYGNARRVTNVLVTATVKNVVRAEPLELLVLRDPRADEARAQVFRAEVQVPEGHFRLEMLTEGVGGYFGAGSKVSFRLAAVDAQAADGFTGFEVALFESGRPRDDGSTPVTVHFTLKGQAVETGNTPSPTSRE